MDSAEPIHLRVSETETAQSLVQQAWGEVRFESLSPTRLFDWRADLIDMGPVCLMANHVDTGARLTGELRPTVVSLMLRGEAHAGAQDDRVKTVRDRQGALYSPHQLANWTCPMGSSSVAMLIEPGYLQRQLELFTGARVEHAIQFQFGLATDQPPGLMIERFCQFMIEHPQVRASLGDPLVASSLSEMIARVLLLGQPHDHAHLLERRPSHIAAHQLARIEEYVAANAGGPIHLAELARLTGASGRSIEASFRAARGGPLQVFVLRQRLEHLRKLLLADAALTPARALRQAGFVSEDDVAIEYARIFGESLQTTWMRGQDRGLGPPARATAAPAVFLIMGDEPLRASLSAALSRCPYPVEIFDSIEAFSLADCARRLGCVMIDLGLPEGRRLAQLCPRLPRIGLSRGDAAEAIEAMRDGALDVLIMPIDPESLRAAIERGFVQDAQQRRHMAEKQERAGKLAALTPRELQVCEQVSRGRLNKQIAAELGISEAMVKAHRGRAVQKLGVRSAAELARLFALD